MMVERVCIVRERQSVMVVRDESKDTILRMSKSSVCYRAETEKNRICENTFYCV